MGHALSVADQLTKRLGAEPLRSSESPGVAGSTSTLGGREVTIIVDGPSLTVGVAISTHIRLCVGACEYPFVVPLGRVGNVRGFGHERTPAIDPTETAVWLDSAAATAWKAAMDLRRGERFEVTVGWAEGNFYPTTDAHEVDRITAMIRAIDELPLVDPIEDSLPIESLGLPAEIRALATDFLGFAEADDSTRERRLQGASDQELRMLASRGGPLLAQIDAILDQADRDPTSPAAAEGSVLLHALAQAVIEAEQELARR